MSTAPVKSHHQPQQHHPQPPQQHRHHQHQQPHQPLHNFSLPSFLKWPSSNGSSRVRREPHLPRPPHLPASSPKRTNDGDGGHTEGDVDPKKEGLDGEGLAEGEDGRKPWNLRPRRAVAAMDAAAAAAGVRNGEQENRPRRNGEGGDQKKEEEEEEGKKKRRRLWIALSKEEIDEDVFIMTGCRPSRRPKKRSKTEQKHLDCVFPGLWLVGMTADAYRVAEAAPKSSVALWGRVLRSGRKDFQTDEEKTRCMKVSPITSTTKRLVEEVTKRLIEEVQHAKLVS